MKLNQRRRFNSTQTWHDYLAELVKSTPSGQEPKIDVLAINKFRKDVYGEIEKIRQRPLLVYFTKFLNPPTPDAPVNLTLEDVDGFTDLISSIDKDQKSIDVLLHSPGGSPDATERIVEILRNRFNDVQFIIPHSAYSAATMLALSGNKILLHPSATLGPIDPQINGIPVRSIKRGFENAKKQIKKEGPESLPAYIPLIEKFSLELLELCNDSEKLAKKLVSNWLKLYMFEKKKGITQKIRKIVKFFSDYDKHLLHARPLTYSKLNNLGLECEVLEGELKDLVWEVYILLSGFLNMTSFVKLYENSNGVSWGKQFVRVITK